MSGFDALGENAIGEFSDDTDSVVGIPVTGALTLSASAPEIRAGVRIEIPAAAPFALSGVVPGPAAGVLVTVPQATAFAISAVEPTVSTGTRIDIPTATIASISANAPPNFSAGVRIDVPAQDEDGFEMPGGSAIAEGEDFIPTRYSLVAAAPAIFAGARINAPAAVIALTTNVPELRARRRAVRVRLATF